MPRANETVLERRRRQLEVIGKKIQSAIDRKDEAAQAIARTSYETTEQDIRDLEAANTEPAPPRRSRREG